jgi:hypothetical protein
MFELLLYSTLTCQQSDALMLKIKTNKYLDDTIKIELVETIKDSAPECEFYWDAND